MYLASQVFQLIALVLDLIAYHFNTKKKIFIICNIGCVFVILHYLFLGAYSGCAAKTITLVRNFFIIGKEKNKKLDNKVFFIIFLLLYIAFGIITYKNIYSIIPTLAGLIFLFYTWDGRELDVKKASLIAGVLLVIYNICILSYAGMLANTIFVISTSIAYYNELRKHKRKTKKR